MANQVEASAFAELVDPHAEMTLIGSGYQFSEGPVWSPRDQCLYFSDIPGDARWRWTEADG
jgi:gluconolactonase